jgi:hypothetical protein
VRKRMQRPSPALAVACLALFVALGGVGYAAATINGKDIKNRTIAAKKLKNKTITAGKVKNNTLTGTQINESTLGQVPSAASATNATTANKALTADKALTTDKAIAADSATNATNAANSEQLQGRSLRQISLWVLFGTGGEVVRSSGNVTVVSLATGRYKATFPIDVSDCIYNLNGGTSAPASDGTNFSNAIGMVGRDSVNPNAVQLEFVNDAGVNINEPGYLSVQC